MMDSPVWYLWLAWAGPPKHARYPPRPAPAARPWAYASAWPQPRPRLPPHRSARPRQARPPRANAAPLSLSSARAELGATAGTTTIILRAMSASTGSSWRALVSNERARFARVAIARALNPHVAPRRRAPSGSGRRRFLAGLLCSGFLGVARPARALGELSKFRLLRLRLAGPARSAADAPCAAWPGSSCAAPAWSPSPTPSSCPCRSPELFRYPFLRAVRRSRASRCRPRPTSRACAATSPTAASC